jgi:hypothetical protein
VEWNTAKLPGCSRGPLKKDHPNGIAFDSVHVENRTGVDNAAKSLANPPFRRSK